MAKVTLYRFSQNDTKTFLEFKKEYTALIKCNSIVINKKVDDISYAGFIENIKIFKFSDPNGIKVNYMINFITGMHNYSEAPLYLYINPCDRLKILFHFRKLWIQQLWFSNLLVSILAIILAFVNVCKK